MENRRRSGSARHQGRRLYFRRPQPRGSYRQIFHSSRKSLAPRSSARERRRTSLTVGVDKSQLVTFSGGEKLEFKEFSVQVIESAHGIVRRGGRTRRGKFEEITPPWSGAITGNAFVEGGSYLYLFTFGKHRLLHQSTGGFIEKNLAGLKAETALLYTMARNDLAEVIKALQPKTVVK